MTRRILSDRTPLCAGTPSEGSASEARRLTAGLAILNRCAVWLPCLLLCFIFVLTGCGRAADTSGLAGSYVLIHASGESAVWAGALAEQADLRIRLDENGEGKILRGTDEGLIRWSLDGSVLTVNAGDLLLTGTVGGDGFELQDADGMVLRFAAVSPTGDSEDSAEDTSDGPTAAEIVTEEGIAFPKEDELLSSSDAWIGAWYGWWSIMPESGEMPQSWYDCCARIRPDGTDTLTLILWDEDGSAEEPLCEMSLLIREDGSAVSLNGYFLFSSIAEGEWTLSRPAPALFLDSGLHDAEGEHFSYSIYLRPWGDPWKDAEQEQLPFYYEDWYLPRIRSREEMPDCIPWQELENERVQTGG